MKRTLTILAVIAALAVVGTGLGVWRLSRSHAPELPEISAYSHGHVVRTGPFRYCPVLDLDNCLEPGAAGELPVTKVDPIQLSVSSSIGRAPWRLLRVYENPVDTTVTQYAPNSTLAVTVPTVDPQRGKLIGLAVQLMTMVQDQNGDQFPLPHAEWSVSTVWPEESSVG